MNEMEKNLLTDSRARLAVSLHKFCDEMGEHDPCLNFRECDECPIKRRIGDLREEVMWDP